jgi:outer membrane protein TolC
MEIGRIILTSMQRTLRGRAAWIVAVMAFGIQPALAQAQAARTPSPLTLGTAIDQALARNDRVVAARDDEQRATIGVRSARAAFNPKVVPSLFSSLGQTDLANQNYGLALRAGCSCRAPIEPSTRPSGAAHSP